MKALRLLSSDKREILAETILFLVIAAISAWPMVAAIQAILQAA